MRNACTHRSHRHNPENGQGLLELALLVPVLLTLTLSIVQVGLVLRAYIVVNDSAREGARLASRGHWFDDSEVLAVINQNLSRIRADGTNTTVVLTRAQSQPDSGAITIKNQSILMGTGESRFNSSNLTTIHQTAIATAVAQPTATAYSELISYLNDEELVVVEISHRYRVNLAIQNIEIPLYSYAMFQVSGGP